MKKAILVTILSILLTVSSSQVFSLNISNKENEFNIFNTDIIFVDKNNTEGPWEGSIDHPFQNISEAIIKAKNGDIIYVLNGTYQEQITVNKSLWILGEDKEKTIIDAQYNEYAIKIIKNNVKIEKLTITNAGGYKENAGIKIISDNCNISDCIIKRNRVGVFLNHTNNSIINNCKVYLNGKGIYTKSSKNLNIKNNEFCYSSIAISSINSSKIEFKESYIHECGTGLFFNVSSNVNFLDCAICDNNDNGEGCFIYNSIDFNFENCNILHNGFGLYIRESDNINLNNCDIENITHYGIILNEKVGRINIDSCSLINNFRRAIFMGTGNMNIRNSNLFNNNIESVKVTSSLCDAKNNWWGSKLGPIFNNVFRLYWLLKKDFGRLKIFPWSLTPYKNAGSDWDIEDRFSKTIVIGYEDYPIKLDGHDTDSDGLPDWWEEKYDDFDTNVWEDHINIDIDGDSLNNFEECYAYEWGADPTKKDIFLEFDWSPTKDPSKSYKPSLEYIEKMKKPFKEHDINLHVDVGQFGGGEEIPYIEQALDLNDLTDFYWDYFLHNDLNNPRKTIFHYGLLCNKGPLSGFAFVGWGHLNGFCVSAGRFSAKDSIILPAERKIITGSMHELGHTLGLFVDDYGGIDNGASSNFAQKEYWIYRNYKSTMNYRYTWFILDYSDGDNGREDYNDWANIEFDFFKNMHFEWPKS